MRAGCECRIGKSLHNSNLRLILASLFIVKHHALATCCTLAQGDTIKWMNGFVRRGKLMHSSLQQTAYLHVICVCCSLIGGAGRYPDAKAEQALAICARPAGVSYGRCGRRICRVMG